MIRFGQATVDLVKKRGLYGVSVIKYEPASHSLRLPNASVRRITQGDELRSMATGVFIDFSKFHDGKPPAFKTELSTPPKVTPPEDCLKLSVHFTV